MWRPLVAIVGVVALTLSGCAAVDWLFGVQPDGTQDPGGGPAGIAAPIANTFIPGAGALLGGLGTLWAALRGRQWKKAATATFDVIESGAKAGKSVQALKAELAVAHSAAGVKGIVQKVVQKYGREA